MEGRLPVVGLQERIALYNDISDDLIQQIRAMGVTVAAASPESPLLNFIRNAGAAGCGARVRNDERSVCRGWLSPACETCARGVGTTTFYLSVACNRDCFFCFNPNQRHYHEYLDKCHDLIGELDKRHANGEQLRDIALTGGEPLLFPEQAVDFFQHAGELYPRAYTRLYTNGDLATPELLERLAAAGLKEIRFSVKRDPGFEDSNDADIIRRIEQAKRCIPHVMVEMPVMPGDLEGMQQLLLGLDGAGCDGINLLELCFPLHNWDEFARRGFEVKNPPFRIPYHYEYAGGLPIDGSESVCLDLLRFAQEAGLRMGVHYCSLENKFTSQINLQNLPYRAPSGRCDLDPTCRFDDDDFFFKTLLLFGRDAIAAAAALEAADAPARAYRLTMASVNSPETCLEADPALAPIITNALPQARCGISLRVVEDSPAGLRIRELAVRPLL